MSTTNSPIAANGLAILRTAITFLTLPSPFLSMEEKLRANHNVYECTDEARLTRWLANVETELARREAAANTPPVVYATVAQREEITRLLNHPAVLRPEKTKVLLNINRLTEVDAAQVIAHFTSITADWERPARTAAAVAAQPLTVPYLMPATQERTADRVAAQADGRREAALLAETGPTYADMARR